MPGGSPFHDGEKYVQCMAGVRDVAEHLGRLMIRSYMPEQHRAFFAEQVLVYMGSVDRDGRPWASALFGAAGFLSSPDPQHLVIAPASHSMADPVNLSVGSKVGGLGLQLHTRRRNRVNGTVTAVLPDGSAVLEVDQSFGNCPKYIQTRDIVVDPARLAAHRHAMQQQQQGAGGGGAGSVVRAPLGPEQIRLVRSADTFFLATCFPGDTTKAVDDGSGAAPVPAAAVGCDVSHRGGPPGFVQAEQEGQVLVWPDYSGNNHFQSLGNIHAHPACGLLFIDWDTGTTLQLTGEARIAYDDRSLPGAQRAVRFKVHEWRHAAAALPIRPSPVLERSPHNPRLVGAGGAPTLVRLTSVRREALGINTFEFEAPPAMRLAIAEGRAPYAPGQFASFDFEVAQDSAPSDAGAGEAAVDVINRTWTISSHPQETAQTGRFTISVKLAGLVSGYLHRSAVPGMQLDFRGVGGDFTPDPESERPALLVAGGIGITPMRVIFRELLWRGVHTVLIYSFRHSDEAAFLQELNQWAGDARAKGGAGAGAAVVATVTGDGDVSWRGRRGRVDAALVHGAAGGANLAEWDVYVCGPSAFMGSVEAAAKSCGANPARIYTETFTY